jgi:hypothetical protein
VVRVLGDGDVARVCADRLRLARFELDLHADTPDVLLVAPAPPPPGRPVRDLPLLELDETWNRTVRASVQAIQEALDVMVERGAGTVVVVVPSPHDAGEPDRPLSLTELLATGALTSIVPVLSRELAGSGVRSVALVAAPLPRVTAEVVTWLVRPDPDSADGPPVLMLDGETLLASAVAQEYDLV